MMSQAAPRTYRHPRMASLPFKREQILLFLQFLLLSKQVSLALSSLDVYSIAKIG